MEATALVTASTLAHTIAGLIRDNQLDEAEEQLRQLNGAYPQARELLVFPVMIAIQRGQAREAWQLVNGTPDEAYPELKALCLRRLGDPSWYGYAEAALESQDPQVRKAMRNLLGSSAHDDIHPLLR
ncbi:HrpB1 family type III secretion system apparatus protein [Paraburkholderia acidipaludis]|uniref:HrpB1 family type III secretion system apparatus protein n=1 Tax=Paraburkholderia acidipaludis TaxID=660537 RepID=UPI0005BCC450|nr:HrpB1 family type III secretion system apparatus protein [Paraburkholderia acidipaludis]